MSCRQMSPSSAGAAPATAMTDRAAAGPSIDDTADDRALVAAALAGSHRRLRRPGHPSPPRRLPGLLPLREPPRGRRRSHAGHVRARLEGAGLVPRPGPLLDLAATASPSTCASTRSAVRHAADRGRSTPSLLEDRREPRPGDALLARERAAAGARGGGRAAAAPARGADPAHLSRAVAPGSGRHRRHQRRRGEGQRLPRARQPAQAPGSDGRDARACGPTNSSTWSTARCPPTRAAHARGVRDVPGRGRRSRRARWAEARAVEVPEPSPSFWAALNRARARGDRRRARRAAADGPPGSAGTRSCRWRAWRRCWWRSRRRSPRPPAALDGPADRRGRRCPSTGTPSPAASRSTTRSRSSSTWPARCPRPAGDALALGAAARPGRGRRHGPDRRRTAGARATPARGRGSAQVMTAPSSWSPRDRRRLAWRPRSWPALAPAAAAQAPPAADAADLRPAEIQRLFDAYLVMEAQQTLGLSDTQYPPFLTRLRALQETPPAPSAGPRPAAARARRG